jgi:sRNA-binding protein
MSKKGKTASRLFTGSKTTTRRVDKKGNVSSSSTHKGLIAQLSEDHSKNVAKRSDVKKSTAKAKYASRTAGYTGISSVGVAKNTKEEKERMQDLKEDSSKSVTPQVVTVQEGSNGTNPVMSGAEDDYYYYD